MFVAKLNAGFKKAGITVLMSPDYAWEDTSPQVFVYCEGAVVDETFNFRGQALVQIYAFDFQDEEDLEFHFRRALSALCGMDAVRDIVSINRNYPAEREVEDEADIAQWDVIVIEN